MKISARLIFIKKNYIVFKNLFKTYQFVIKSLIYTMLDIRSNIVLIVLIIFCYAINLINAHHFIIKRIFRYLRVIVN